MDINIPSPSGKNPESSRQQGQDSALRLLNRLGIESGETRLARVMAALDDASGGKGARLLLEVNGKQLPVRSEQSLQPGTLIRIMRAANELRLMELPESPQRSVLSQALARKMPFQHNLGEGLNQLLNSARSNNTPQPVREALQQLTQLIFQPRSTTPPQATSSAAIANAPAPSQNPLQGEAITPERVRQWFSENGIFREARLVTAQPQPSAGIESTPLSRDLKQRLIQLAVTAARHQAGDQAPRNQVERQLASVQPSISPQLVNATHLQFPAPEALMQSLSQTPAQTGSQAGAGREPMGAGEILRLLAGMINRITVNQLHSQALTNPATAEAPASQTWILELPWLTASGEARLAQARIEQRDEASEDSDEDGEASNQREWRLTLAIDLDHTGPLYFDLSLKKRALKARIWAEKPATLALVEQTNDQLHSALSKLNLDVAPIECHQGQPVALKTRLSQYLVDEHA